VRLEVGQIRIEFAALCAPDRPRSVHVVLVRAHRTPLHKGLAAAGPRARVPCRRLFRAGGGDVISCHHVAPPGLFCRRGQAGDVISGHHVAPRGRFFRRGQAGDVISGHHVAPRGFIFRRGQAGGVISGHVV
jgi:hypothetical protein